MPRINKSIIAWNRSQRYRNKREREGISGKYGQIKGQVQGINEK